MIKICVAVVAAASLAGCVAPTPYRASGAGEGFGYTSKRLSDQLFRVQFLGSSRTPPRWVDAFLLYRSAELAREAGATHFRVLEGVIDDSVLEGDEIFGRANGAHGVDGAHGFDGIEGVVVATAVGDAAPWGEDRVRGVSPLAAGLQRTAGAMPVFRAPMPMPKAPPPVMYYVPGAVYSVPRPIRSVLIDLRPEAQAEPSAPGKTFVVAEVLDKLGPRIKREAPKAAPAASPPPTAL